jgi:hypothetical protein
VLSLFFDDISLNFFPVGVVVGERGMGLSQD